MLVDLVEFTSQMGFVNQTSKQMPLASEFHEMQAQGSSSAKPLVHWFM